MTHAVTMVQQGTDGNVKYSIFDLAITVYTATGEPLPASEMGMGQVLAVDAEMSSTGYFFAYDFVNAKMVVWMYNNAAVASGAMMDATASADVGVCRTLVKGYG